MVCQSFLTEHRGTKRTMGLLYLILSLLLNDEVHSVFEAKKYQDPFSWQKAINCCDRIGRNLTIAVPFVNLSSMTLLDKIELQGEAWVGYFQIHEYFLFIVCVPLSALESLVFARFNIGGDKNRPGLCYSFCGLQGYIGLQGDLCYCIETRTFSTQNMHSVNSSCDKPLHCANGMLCGTNGSSTIPVYKKVTISSTSSNDITGKYSGCMIVTREYKMLLAKCEDRFQHLCESYTGQTLNIVESLKQDQWAYSIKDCTRAGQNPTTFIGNGTNFVFPNTPGPWWTSIIRDLVIRNCSGSMPIYGTHLYEGFLKPSTEGIKLEFVSGEINSMKMSVACMYKQSSNEQENSTTEPTEIPKSFPTSEASTMSRIAVLTVIMPVGLAALVLMSVVTITVVFWRRRKDKATTNVKPSKQKTTKDVVPHNSERQQVYYEHKTATLNKLEENDQGHISAEYDSLNEYNAHFSVPTGNLYDKSNFNIAEETHSVTFSANTLRQVVDLNSYDHVKMKKAADGKYDHVEPQNQLNSVNDIDTYDQWSDFPLDNTYYDTFQHK